MSQLNQRREFERFTFKEYGFHNHVSLFSLECRDIGDGEWINISPRGMFLATESHLELLQHIRLRFSMYLPGPEPEDNATGAVSLVLEVKARVLRKEALHQGDNGAFRYGLGFENFLATPGERLLMAFLEESSRRGFQSEGE